MSCRLRVVCVEKVEHKLNAKEYKLNAKESCTIVYRIVNKKPK